MPRRPDISRCPNRWAQYWRNGKLSSPYFYSYPAIMAERSADDIQTWAFLEIMKSGPTPSYAQTLQMTRQLLDQSNYKQIPQLSSGLDIDLENMPLVL